MQIHSKSAFEVSQMDCPSEPGKRGVENFFKRAQRLLRKVILLDGETGGIAGNAMRAHVPQQSQTLQNFSADLNS